MADIEEREREKEPQRLSVIGPDGVDGFGQHYYKLGHLVIINYLGEIDWEYCKEEPSGELSQIAGDACIEDCDVLLMSAWKVGIRSGWKSLDEYREWRDSLPLWDKTTYFLKMVDTFPRLPSISHTGLTNCQTLEPAPVEVAECIMPKLGFTRSKV